MQLFWILLFGNFVALSEGSIQLAAGAHQVPLKRPISAITSGAALYIDVTSMIPRDELTVHASRKWAEQSFGPGCLNATLQADGEPPVLLEFKGGVSFAPDSLHLILSGPNFSVPVRKDFTKLTLTNCTPLRGVRIYWANYRK